MNGKALKLVWEKAEEYGDIKVGFNRWNNQYEAKLTKRVGPSLEVIGKGSNKDSPELAILDAVNSINE